MHINYVYILETSISGMFSSHLAVVHLAFGIFKSYLCFSFYRSQISHSINAPKICIGCGSLFNAASWLRVSHVSCIQQIFCTGIFSLLSSFMFAVYSFCYIVGGWPVNRYMGQPGPHCAYIFLWWSWLFIHLTGFALPPARKLAPRCWRTFSPHFLMSLFGTSSWPTGPPAFRWLCRT